MASGEAPPQYEFRPTRGKRIGRPTQAERADDFDFKFRGAIPMNVDHRPKNVILFGQTGAGKSSLVNLLAGCEIAKVSSSQRACTLEAQAYPFAFPGPTDVNLFDTVGLQEPEIGVNSFFGAIAKAHQLIQFLHKTGGIDLLVFCIHGGRVTTTMQQNYRLFFEFLCACQVPVAIAVTNLEQEERMEDWWHKNEATLDKYGIRSVAHACVIAAPIERLLYAKKRVDSMKALRKMLSSALRSTTTSYVQEKRTWHGAVIGGLGSLLPKSWSQKSAKKDISCRLENDCGLLRDDADKLAEMLVSDDKYRMSTQDTNLMRPKSTEQTELPLHDDPAQLKQVIDKLCRDLAESQCAVDEQKACSESLQRENDEIAQLKQVDEKLRRDLAESQTARRAAEEHNELLRSQATRANEEITLLERANGELQCIIRLHEQKHRCETLYAQGRTFDAAKHLLEIENVAGESIKSNKLLSDWLTESMTKCIQTLEKIGDGASNAGKLEEAVAAFAAALSLGSSTPDTLLAKWASVALADTPPLEVLHADVEFKTSRFAVYRAVCNNLEEVGRLSEAIETLGRMQDDLQGTCTSDQQTQWERDFRERCAKKLVELGEAAQDSKKHDEAIQCYSDAISLCPTNLNEILLKRGNALIDLDPLSHEGYKEKHAALNTMGRYSEAFEPFKAMLSIFEQSRDPKIRELRHQYVDATSAIQEEVEKAIRHLPTVLINTDTGCLYDKSQQAAAFEKLPIYDELRSSMTTTLDHSRIRKEVKKFYRYVMFSHTWQHQVGEPTFQQVESDSIHNLPLSATFDKLRNFCKLVVTLQFNWAWTDTCCINQRDQEVQRESIVAMFRWYRHSSLTVIYLLGIWSESLEAGCIWKSRWNSRGWTYQEYVASEVVQFYTEDWKPYLGLQTFNHKESSDVLLEMERATNATAQQLTVLKPGFDRAREKLYLASGRQTTREEDMAYSLFGIFDVALPVMYGEGNLAIRRLLEHILPQSEEVTLLSWTGQSDGRHSYLPASLTAYNEIVAPHVPAPVETSEMDRVVSAIRLSIPDPAQMNPIIDLYERLANLPPLSLVAGRLKLPGIVFQLSLLGHPSKSGPRSSIHVYHATSPLLGNIEIKTTADLSRMSGLRLIHPWISPLIDQDFLCHEPLFDQDTCALRLLARLRQPFGGLLLSPSGRSRFRRVATDSLIMVQIQEEVTCSELIDAIHTVMIQ